MNVKHYLFAFFLIIAAMIVRLSIKIDNLEKLDSRTSVYNETIDNAVDDSLHSMLELSDSFSHTVNLDYCSENFFRALYAGFGLSDSATGKAQLSNYVPILILTDTDGFYIMYHSFDSTGTYTSLVWTPKQPYYYSGSISGSLGSSPATYSYHISYTMTKKIKLNIRVSGKEYNYEGNYDTIETIYENKAKDPSSDVGYSQLLGFLSLMRASGKPLAPENFDRFRQSVMIHQITKKANYYVNKHNDIAQSYGISYHFELPESSMDTFARTIDDISLLAIFQGYPYGKGMDDVYSRFSVSGARVFKTERYYVLKDGSGFSYYHRPSCHDLSGKKASAYSFDTKSDCAKFGAYPCPKCRP